MDMVSFIQENLDVISLRPEILFVLDLSTLLRIELNDNITENSHNILYIT